MNNYLKTKLCVALVLVTCVSQQMYPASTTWYPDFNAIVQAGRNDLVKEHIESGKALVDGRGQSGMTPLMTAAQYGRKDVVEYLLDAGAYPFYTTMDGETADTLADRGGYSEISALIRKRQEDLSKYKK